MGRRSKARPDPRARWGFSLSASAREIGDTARILPHLDEVSPTGCLVTIGFPKFKSGLGRQKARRGLAPGTVVVEPLGPIVAEPPQPGIMPGAGPGAARQLRRASIRLMKHSSIATIVAAAIAILALSGHAQDGHPNRDHPTLAATLGGSRAPIRIIIDRWQHWSSNDPPREEIEKILRSEIDSYLYVNPEDRTKLEHSNSRLWYSGEGRFILANGVEVPWKHTSAILSVRVPGKHSQRDWRDFAPREWVLKLEEDCEGPAKK